MKMKKTVLLLLVFTAMLSTLTAGDNPWSVKSFKLGLGNDKYAYGFSRNDDDQLSYSEHFTVAAEKWYIQVDLDGITNRGWKKGWDIKDSTVIDKSEGDFYSGRIDLTEVKFGYNYTHDFPSVFSLRISPETGFFLSGYTGYDFFQNTIHKLAKIQLVHLPYDSESVAFSFYLGLDTELFTNIYSLESSTLAISLGGKVYSAFGFETGERVNATLTLYNNYNEILALTLGMNWVQEHNSSPTMELYSRYINSPYAGYTINTGFFALNYYTELTNHFGYAVLSFDVMSLFHPTTWKENDIYFSMGFAKMMGLRYCDQELNWPIGNNLSLVFRNKYVAGYPVSKTEEISADLSHLLRIKQGHVMNTIGIEYEFPIASLKNWVTPYASLSLGYMKWDITMLSNMIKDNLNPSYPLNYGGDKPKFSFVLDVEAGVTIVPEGLISFKSTSFTLSVFAGCAFVTGEHVYGYRRVAETKDELKLKETSSDIKNNFLPRWGLTLNFGFDI